MTSGSRHDRCVISMGPMRLASMLFSVLITACAFEAPPANLPEPNRGAQFDDEVYPQLLRDCGFPACHGNRDRFFRVFGPGRTRLDEMTPLGEAPTVDEREAAYERARSMLAGAGRSEDTLLLRKPLEVDQGGAPHVGIDEHGQDVYGDVTDDGYELLLLWAQSGFRGSP